MKPYLEILKLVWPLALGMINNAVMQFADRAFLAGYSMTAFEAALPASTLSWVFVGFFQAIVAYSGVFVAHYHGANDRRMCFVSFKAGTAIAAVSGALILALVPAADWILGKTAPYGELLALEREYCDICLAGGFFVCAQMAASSYFTGRGQTRLVFWVNLLGNAINIALDPFLIFGWCSLPRLGVAGAAYATVASTALQWAVLVFAVFREGGEKVAGTVRRPPKREFAALVWRMLRFGVPAGAYNVLSMLSFTVFVFVTELVGDLEFATSNAVFTVNYLLYAPMEGFAIGAQTLVGQARGRGDDKEAALAARRTVVLAALVALVLSIAAIAACPLVLSAFAPSDAALKQPFMALGFKLFMLMGCWLVMDAVDTVLCGALKGAGDTKFVMWWMSFCAFGVWLPLVCAAAALCNTMPVLWSTMVVYVVVICFGSAARWRKGKWRTIAVVRGGALT